MTTLTTANTIRPNLENAPTLHFQIDEPYLIMRIAAKDHIRFVADKVDPQVQSLYRKLREVGEADCDLINDNWNSWGISKLWDIAQRLHEQVKATDEYRSVFDSTHENMTKLSENWQEMLESSYAIIYRLTGVEFGQEICPDKDFSVFVLHPSICAGGNFNSTTIECPSSNPDIPHWNNIYLWHEIFHNQNLCGNDEALVEVICDHQLRHELDSEQVESPIGHPQLSEMRAILVPAFEKYLGQRTETPQAYNIATFIKEMRTIHGSLLKLE